MTKLLVCDPACAQKLGHNFTSLLQFRQFFQGSHAEIRLYGSKSLVNTFKPSESLHGIIPYFSYTYYNELPLYLESGARIGGPKIERQLIQREDFINQWKQLIATHAGSEATILLPSAEIDSLRALRQIAEDNHRLTNVRLIIRLIGVMEYAHGTPRSEFISIAKRLRELWSSLIICTETKAYASLLNQIEPSLNAKFAPHPPLASTPSSKKEATGKKSGNSFTICCPGSNRLDKGYQRLPDIIEQANHTIGFQNIRWIIQDAPPSQIRNQAYDTFIKLHRIPNCEVLPSKLNEEDILGIYRRSHVALLPYCSQTYQYRGSAILPEAASHHLPVVSSKATAFSEDILQASCGILASSNHEFSALISLLALDFQGGKTIYNALSENTAQYLAQQKKAWEALFEVQ